MNLVKRMWRSEVFRVVFTLALVFLAVQGAWMVMKVILGTEVPLAYVPSRSMEPTLRVGDLVVIEGVEPREISLGDILVFYVPGHYGEDSYRIVHRVVTVVQVDGTLGFETKGDNNPSSDLYRWGYIPASHVVGVVKYRIPYVGYLAIKLREPLGILIVVLIILIFVVTEFTGLNKGKHKEKR
ncbi:MAG: signal peptidase I [Candidatus Bathyarchaeia archaeon]